MLIVQNKSMNICPGDIIAFFKRDEFIGYGRVVSLYENEAVIDEDHSVRKMIDNINNQGSICDIEIL